jgi:uncharacterized protein with NRDE domain
VVAANRDEFYSRPTHPLSYWGHNPDLLAGKDLQAGGTWLGITRTGRFSALTNFREPQKKAVNAPSRGMLTRGFLEDTSDPETYLKKVDSEKHVYHGFNLLVGDLTGDQAGGPPLCYLSNRSVDNRTGALKLRPGIYGLSNRILDTPWPKVTKGKSALQSLLYDARCVRPSSILEILCDQDFPPDNQLPDTGVGLAWERVLSPLFITSNHYGTRSSSVVLVEKTGEVTFVERTYEADASGVKSFSNREFSFQINKS